VDLALRSVIAAILKHCQLVKHAMAFATDTSQPTPSPELKRAYRHGYRVKKWFIQQHQAASLTSADQEEEKEDSKDKGTKADPYHSLAAGVAARAQVLLKFSPTSLLLFLVRSPLNSL